MGGRTRFILTLIVIWITLAPAAVSADSGEGAIRGRAEQPEGDTVAGLIDLGKAFLKKFGPDQPPRPGATAILGVRAGKPVAKKDAGQVEELVKTAADVRRTVDRIEDAVGKAEGLKLLASLYRELASHSLEEAMELIENETERETLRAEIERLKSDPPK